MTYVIILGCLAMMIATIWLARSDDRPVVAIIAVSALYYGLGGQLYWVGFMQGIFGGLQWDPAKLSEASILLFVTSLAMVLLIAAGGAVGRLSHGRNAVDAYYLRQHLPPPKEEARGLFEILFLAVGIACSIYVLAKGSFAANFRFDARGGLFLIAYQLSDILVAWLCFDVARRGVKPSNLALLGYFVLYAVMVGFRYKIAIIALPLITYGLTAPIDWKRKSIVVSTAAVTVFALFSLMTLFRVKFGAPDFSRGLQNAGADLTYGALAETNIIFGFTSILRVHIEGGVTAGVQPVVDAFLELVPRIILPYRATGEYLKPMIMGFLTDQGMNSGTSYPWVGEFVIMFGYWGLFVGPIVFAVMYFLLKHTVRSAAADPRQYYMGLYLLATVVGYYHFGRGYTPQLLKCYLFVFLPYVIMCLERLLPARSFRVSLAPIGVRSRAAP